MGEAYNWVVSICLKRVRGSKDYPVQG